ncbi:hypothetical protein Tco_1359276 [Tanacetum coccineum]
MFNDTTERVVLGAESIPPTATRPDNGKSVAQEETPMPDPLLRGVVADGAGSSLPPSLFVPTWGIHQRAVVSLRKDAQCSVLMSNLILLDVKRHRKLREENDPNVLSILLLFKPKIGWFMGLPMLKTGPSDKVLEQQIKKMPMGPFLCCEKPGRISWPKKTLAWFMIERDSSDWLSEEGGAPDQIAFCQRRKTDAMDGDKMNAEYERTNFPDSTTSSDLWKLCQSYGSVVDVYIPNRRSKAGETFVALVRLSFNKVNKSLIGLVAKSKLMKHVGVASWFKSLSDAQSDFLPRDRIVWVDIEGVPMHAWSRNTFHKIGSKMEAEYVLDLQGMLEGTDFFARCFHLSSEVAVKELQTPRMDETGMEIVSSRLQTEEVGQTMGFSKLDGSALFDMEKIIGSQGVDGETKSDNISDMAIKHLWGNSLLNVYVSEALGNSGAFPHLSAVCLDRHLSDHHPILLREVCIDYGATPFRLFHSWFEYQGFDAMVSNTWNSIILYDKNGMIRFKKKLQILKKDIRTWIADHKKSKWMILLVFRTEELGISEEYVAEAAALIGCSVMHTPFSARVPTPNPIYYMSLYKIPKSVLHSLEAIRRNFFNGTSEGDRRITWVKWLKVLASKINGGLGVSSFYALNRGLLAKWMWRFLSREKSLWVRFIQAAHGSNTQVISTSYPSIWSSIIKELNALKSLGFDFFSHCKIRVGNGRNTIFWKDLWIGDSCLSLAFPRLYALENNKDCTVADKYEKSPELSDYRQAWKIVGFGTCKLVTVLDDLDHSFVWLDNMPLKFPVLFV